MRCYRFKFLLNKIEQIFLTICVLYSPFTRSQGQNDLTKKNLEVFTIAHFDEKIYAHLNRTDHITGEVLWFKIYCVDERLHRPLDISKIAYAEILDHDNKPVLQTKVPLVNGEGSGSLFIPATLPSGYYLFRTYTNWMKNNPGFFFQEKISIVNTLKASEPSSPQIINLALDVQFFPEGGMLVEGVRSRVGLKVTDSNGLGVDCSGALLNQSGDTVSTFKTLKFGIGSFLFTPQAKQTYKAIIFNKRVTSAFAFPQIQKTGYGLLVKDTLDDKIKIVVTNPDGLLTVRLFIHTRQSIKISEARTTHGKVSEFIVDKKMLGDGISQITILNPEGAPVCERLYFKKPSQSLKVKSSVDQKEYSTRRKVQLALENRNAFDESLSISVFRGDSIALHQNIANYLLLKSDLVGDIESPDYYFSEGPATSEAADNLMLTQGWRRFNWKSVTDKKKSVIKYLPELKGHLIQGRILDKDNNPVPGKVGYLATPGKKIRLYVAKSDSAGVVYFQMKDFQETGKIIAQTNYELDSLCHIEIDSPFSSEFASWLAGKLLLNNSIEDELTERSIGMQVQDAFYEDETYFRFKNIQTDSIPFYGIADETYLLDDYTRFPVLEEVMREYVKGVWVRKRKEEFRFMVIDKLHNGVFRDNPLTLLDGVPVFNVNKVLEIDPLRIKKLEIMTRKYFLGPLELHGILSLSTYNGDLGGFEPDPRSVILDYEGLQSLREFYSPRYTSPELRGSRLPDQRYQLYWNPFVKIMGGQVAPIEFYTSDVEGNFFVVVEGLSKNGMPCYSSTSFRVSR